MTDTPDTADIRSGSDTYVSTAGDSVTARLIASLDRVWAEIRARHPDVPPVVATIGAGSIGTPPGTLKFGHFAAGRWQHGQGRMAELFVGGEGLQHGPLHVLGTLLHEAAHGVARIRGVKDTSRQGRFHNRRYKTIAEELGLTVATTGSIGWSHTTVSKITATSYLTQLEDLAQALTAWRHAESARPERTTRNNGVAATCGCPRRIRVAPTVLQLAPILCGLCGQEFTT